jgi:hypothetical protein
LAEQSVETLKAFQEDWGGELPAKLGNDSYYLGVGGNRDNSIHEPDEGEARIIVQKRRSLWQRMTGGGQTSADDPRVRIIEGVLITEPTIRDVHRD